eukprot:1158451-Pelagomonas_calceolata.AAC.5
MLAVLPNFTSVITGYVPNIGAIGAIGAIGLQENGDSASALSNKCSSGGQGAYLKSQLGEPPGSWA